MAKYCYNCKAVYLDDTLKECPECMIELESEFQQPLDPLRNSASLLTVPPVSMLERTRPAGTLSKRIIYVGEPVDPGRRNTPERSQISPNKEISVMNQAANNNHEVPDDIIDVDMNNVNTNENTEVLSEEINEIPAGDLYADDIVPQENLDDINPEYMNGGGDYNRQQDEILDAVDNDLYNNNMPPAEEREGLLHRIFHNNDNNNDTIHDAGTGTGSRILNFLLHLARLAVPLIMLILLIAAVIINWAAIKSILLIFATAWIISFGALIIFSHHHLNHNAIFALSTAIGVIAVIVSHCAILSCSIKSTLYSLLVPIFIVWVLITLIRGVLNPR